MPAAAVIPALIAYIKVVAVKKLVVGFWVHEGCWPLVERHSCAFLPLSWWLGGLASFTVKKLECLKQAFAHLNTLAWNNGIGPWCYFVGCGTGVMINRDSWGRSYFVVRGEILGFTNDELVRKHSARMFSLIKNES